MVRTLVMRVRYARRISVDVATEETPSAAYRSGSPESAEAGAAGIVAEGWLESGHVKRHAGVPTKGERTRLRRADPWRTETEGRVAGVLAVARGAGRRVRCVRRSDTRERRDDETPPRRTRREKGRRIGETSRPTDVLTIGRSERTRPFHRLDGSVPNARDSFLTAWTRGATKKRTAENPQPARALTIPRRPARARALLIRTMVSPNATDDPESAEQQPKVRALSDRCVRLDERGRGASAFSRNDRAHAGCRRETLPRPPRASPRALTRTTPPAPSFRTRRVCSSSKPRSRTSSTRSC